MEEAIGVRRNRAGLGMSSTMIATRMRARGIPETTKAHPHCRRVSGKARKNPWRKRLLITPSRRSRG
jgi:hypothetical protein